MLVLLPIILGLVFTLIIIVIVGCLSVLPKTTINYSICIIKFASVGDLHASQLCAKPEFALQLHLEPIQMNTNLMRGCQWLHSSCHCHIQRVAHLGHRCRHAN